ncbi:MAG TPA: NHL repeat-containing protein [Edaphobacter sp.]|jgi:streptogramin lyase|nr:NHL repeat-containing protein [Edaphobacter sp.]
MHLRAFLLAMLCMSLAGCAGNYSAPPPTAPAAGAKISGDLHGGQQPIVGAHVYLFAANTTGYGQPSVSLLNPTVTGLSDSIGAYVTTNDQGGFSITNDYSCTPNTQVYLYALGGNPGAGINTGAGLLAALGNCPSSGSFLTTVPFISVNEVTTIAAAYAMAGFATDATHVSSSGTSLAKTAIANAFTNAANLADISAGTALTTTPAGNGNAPNTLINTLANILAACINSSSASTPCSTLFSNSLSGGMSGTTPTDTATAIINIAHNPGSNIAALFSLSSATPPFVPSLGAVPNDFSVFLRYNFPGINSQSALTIAIDGSGNAWIPNVETNSIIELASNGALISPSAGYADGQLSNPSSVAIDDSGNAWVTNINTKSVTKLASNGAVISPPSGFTGGGLDNPLGIAIDGNGDAWISNDSGSTTASVTKLSSTGTAISPAAGFVGGGLGHPFGIAIDSAGSAWIANISNNSASKFSSAGVAISPPTGFTGGGLDAAFGIAIDNSGSAWISNGNSGNDPNRITKLSNDGVPQSTGFTGGGLNFPIAIAIDGSGSAWIANLASSISRFSNSGAPISPSTGYNVGPHFLNAIAVDGSGSVWITTDTAVEVFIGAATPVVTPIATAVKNNSLGARP